LEDISGFFGDEISVAFESKATGEDVLRRFTGGGVRVASFDQQSVKLK
jgi:hypothetical protein